MRIGDWVTSNNRPYGCIKGVFWEIKKLGMRRVWVSPVYSHEGYLLPDHVPVILDRYNLREATEDEKNRIVISMWE